MRVLINGWFSKRNVGSGIYTERLVGALRAGSAATDRYDVMPAPASTGNLSKILHEQLRFPFASRGADVAHVPYWAPPVVPGAPTVITVHDLIPMLVDDYRQHASVRAYTALVSRATRRAAAVIADSTYTAADIAAHLPVEASEVHVVPLGVDPMFRPASDSVPPDTDDAVRRAYDLPTSFGLYLGGFDQRKNLATLFASWREVFEATRVPLIVAGDPPRPGHPWARHPAEVARSAQLPADAMRLIGNVPLAELPSLYRAAAVFVYPSRYEGFGLPPLEAMACGTPVVSSNATSLPEVVGDAGLLVDPDDISGLAEAVVHVLGDPVLAEDLRRLGPLRAERFTWAATARRTRAVYESVAR